MHKTDISHSFRKFPKKKREKQTAKCNEFYFFHFPFPSSAFVFFNFSFSVVALSLVSHCANNCTPFGTFT